MTSMMVNQLITSWKLNKQLGRDINVSTFFVRANIIDMKKRWFYNKNTLEEKLAEPGTLDENWFRGRVPYECWPEERKQSYREKHSNIQFSESEIERRKKYGKFHQTNNIGYTDGTRNIWVKAGSDVPEGFYPGWTVTEPWKYWPDSKKEEYIRNIETCQQKQ